MIVRAGIRGIGITLMKNGELTSGSGLRESGNSGPEKSRFIRASKKTAKGIEDAGDHPPHGLHALHGFFCYIETGVHRPNSPANPGDPISRSAMAFRTSGRL